MRKLKIHTNFQKSALFFLCFCAVIAIYCIAQDNQHTYACLECHSKEKLDLDKKFIHPLASKEKCSDCHVYYDQATHSETNRPVLDICLGCHTTEELGRSHPVGEGIIDPNTQGPMTCVSTCHLPHGSDYKYQLPFKNNMELCLSCHKSF